MKGKVNAKKYATLHFIAVFCIGSGEARTLWITKFCKRVDSHLVEINSEEENTSIKAEIGRRGFASRKIEFCLGITDRHSEGTCVFESNGESLPFSDWRKGEPNDQDNTLEEDCAHWNAHLKWIDRSCGVGWLYLDGLVWNLIKKGLKKKEVLSVIVFLFRSARTSWNTFVRPFVRGQEKSGSAV